MCTLFRVSRRDIGALRRLQREAFEALAHLRARLVVLEAGSDAGGGGGGGGRSRDGLTKGDIQVAGLLETTGSLLNAGVCEP